MQLWPFSRSLGWFFQEANINYLYKACHVLPLSLLECKNKRGGLGLKSRSSNYNFSWTDHNPQCTPTTDGQNNFCNINKKGGQWLMISKALPTQIGMKLYSGKSSARKTSVSSSFFFFLLHFLYFLT